MSNRKELAKARRREREAAFSRAQIEALPRRVGQKVMWSNGVIWERVGDDAWQAGGERGWHVTADGDTRPFLSDSAHVASSGNWWPYRD